MISRIIQKYIKPFAFESDTPDKIKPIRFFTSIFLFLIITILVIKIISPNWLTDWFVATMFGGLTILLGADTWRSNAKDKYTQSSNGLNGRSENDRPF